MKSLLIHPIKIIKEIDPNISLPQKLHKGAIPEFHRMQNTLTHNQILFCFFGEKNWKLTVSDHARSAKVTQHMKVFHV